jgi:hypothetical protein
MFRYEARILSRGGSGNSVKSSAHNTGKSAIHKSAYNGREALIDEKTGVKYDYSKRFGGAGAEMLLPESAPAWMADRGKFWNAVERVENRKDSQLAKDFIITLPYGLTTEQRRAALREFLTEHFVSKGKVVDIGYHDYGEPWKAWAKGTPDKLKEWEGKGIRFYELDQLPNQDNAPHVAVIRGREGRIKEYALFQPHAHVMVPFRNIDPRRENGFARLKDRTPEGINPAKLWEAELQHQRKAWADTLNRHLEAVGREERVDHRSLKDRGIDREPEPKKGPLASLMEREGRAGEAHAISHPEWGVTAVRERNALRARLKEVHAQNVAKIYDLDQERLKRQGTRPMSETTDSPTEPDPTKQAEQQRERYRQAEQVHRDQQREYSTQKLIADGNKAAEDAERDKVRRQKEDAARASAGEPVDARNRYAQALGATFTIRDPFGSMANAAMAEYQMFHQGQQDLKAQAAKEPDPGKKQMIELRRQIELHDYMAITHERMAGISRAITRGDNDIARVDDHAVKLYSERAMELRAEMAGQRQQTEQKERQTIAQQLEQLRKDLGKDREVAWGHAGQQGARTTPNAMHNMTVAERTKMAQRMYIAASEGREPPEAEREQQARNEENTKQREGLRPDQPAETRPTPKPTTREEAAAAYIAAQRGELTIPKDRSDGRSTERSTARSSGRSGGRGGGR